MSPLIVPIQAQAMVLNNPDMQFIRAAMNYGQLNSYGDPAPEPFQSDETSFAAKPGNQGVYLAWTLPAALRHGRHQPGTGKVEFPFAPNRWLVTRLLRPQGTELSVQAPQASFWIIQSDQLNTGQGSSYVDPTQPATLTATLIGGSTPITAEAPWQEPQNPPAYFLRAVSEANPAFAAYQPFHGNVFSFFDQPGTAACTLSYYVLGWYSDPCADILAGWPADGDPSAVAAFLNTLNWTESSDSTPSGPLQSLYQGAACSISWVPGGAPPPSPNGGIAPSVAVGNTSIDGVVAFAESALAAQSPTPTDPTPQEAGDLLEAFQYNVLPVLDEPGGELLLEERLRRQWFASAHAGTDWVIVDAPTPPGSQPQPSDPAELAGEAVWLHALNQAQAQSDTLKRTLMAVQRRLFELWWKQGAGRLYAIDSNDGQTWPWLTSQNQFTTFLSPLISQAQGLQNQLDTLAPQLPTPSNTTTLAQAIAAFAAGKNLSPKRLLKAVSQPRFWSSADPVVVVSNTAHMIPSDPSAPLLCRWPSQLLSQLNVSAADSNTQGPQFPVTSAQLAPWQPAVPATNLPPPLPSLFAECFLLDPSNAPLLAAAAGQQLTPAQLAAVAAGMGTPSSTQAGAVPPAILPPYPWAAPWQPLFLDWQIDWYPIPFQQADGTPNWTFNGSDYVLSESFAPLSATPLSMSGRSVLTPKPSFEFQSRIDQFITDYPGTDVAQQLQSIEGALDWDFLSQRLGGLEAQIAKWYPVPTQKPDSTPLPGGGSMQSLIGGQAHMPPNPQQANAPRFAPAPTSTFEGLRAGQFVINQLTVVDAWGQTMPVVLPPVAPDVVARAPGTDAVFVPLVGDGVAPTGILPGQEDNTPERFVELPPRLLQPARLNFRFTPQANGNPIVGWILPNHLDSGLSIYGPDGTGYGELILAVNASDQQTIDWLPAPGSPYPALPAAASDLPALLNFLAELQASGPSALFDFLSAVDETLWTVDPLGNRADTFLSVLIGRPLAVVAATLGFELQAEAWRDTDWPFTFAQPQPDPLFLGYQFPVRLGDLGYREDGLLGYFTNGNYTHFQAVHLPEGGCQSQYLQQIAPGNYVNLGFAAQGPGPSTALTMILDPRGSIHAQCALLPVKAITLPSNWVDHALATIQILFRTGPSLVGAGSAAPVAPAQGPPAPGILLPRPAERKGTWTWQEKTLQDSAQQQSATAGWAELLLLPVDATATLADTPPTLREGWLTLTGGLKD